MIPQNRHRYCRPGQIMENGLPWSPGVQAMVHRGMPKQKWKSAMRRQERKKMRLKLVIGCLIVAYVAMVPVNLVLMTLFPASMHVFGDIILMLVFFGFSALVICLAVWAVRIWIRGHF